MPEYSKNDVRILECFGAAIRARRDSLDMSQEELAERASLHRTYISGVELGRRNVSLINIVKIACALDADPGALVSGMPKPRRASRPRT